MVFSMTEYELGFEELPHFKQPQQPRHITHRRKPLNDKTASGSELSPLSLSTPPESF